MNTELLIQLLETSSYHAEFLAEDQEDELTRENAEDHLNNLEELIQKLRQSKKRFIEF